MSVEAQANGAPYSMVTGKLVEDEVHFDTPEDFREAMNVGFFRIKAPDDLDLEAGRLFARTFTSAPRYTTFGQLDVVNGFLYSPINQTERFSLERDRWNECHVNKRKVEGPPNFPPEVQKLGHKLHKIGINILRSILKQYRLPQELWFKATGGCSDGEGSHTLLFNCYDPKNASKPHGVGAHKDWGYITVLDATQPGLEARIDGVWRALRLEEGYLTINFGNPLERLLPGVHASEHRVITQSESMRTSTVAFIEPRAGPFRDGIKAEDPEGYVYDWDADTQTLIRGESARSYYKRSSDELYGADQSGGTADQ